MDISRRTGQRIAALTGSEPRGMPLSVLFAPASRSRLATQVELAFRMPSVVELALRAPGYPRQRALSGRLLLLPLQDNTGAVTRCLCALVADGRTRGRTGGRTGRGLRQFMLCDDEHLRHEPLDPARVAPQSTDQHPGESQTRAPEGPPPLRLVEDNG